MNYDDLVCFDKIEPFGGYKLKENNSVDSYSYLMNIENKIPNGTYCIKNSVDNSLITINVAGNKRFLVFGPPINDEQLMPIPGKPGIFKMKLSQQEMHRAGFDVVNKDYSQKSYDEAKDETKKHNDDDPRHQKVINLHDQIKPYTYGGKGGEIYDQMDKVLRGS